MRHAFAALLALLALAVPALADRGGDDAAGAVTNPTCPVMEGEKVDPTLFVEYRGKRVYFCCESCISDFEKDPERYIAKLPQFAEGASPAAPPVPAPGPTVPAAPREHALGALHPIAVHFPIALVMVGAFAAALAALFKAAFFRHAATYTILLAAITVVPAWLLGDEARQMRGKMSDSLAATVDEHEDVATVAMYVVLAAGVLQALSALRPGSAPLRLLALLAVFAAAGAVGYAGYLGGEILRPGHLRELLPFLPA